MLCVFGVINLPIFMLPDVKKLGHPKYLSLILLPGMLAVDVTVDCINSTVA